jgi:protein-S-isoprenylcysteine O-methyltransferase Ste14
MFGRPFPYAQGTRRAWRRTGARKGQQAVNEGTPAYGLWGLVLVNSAIFIIFAFSFFHPKTKRDWRSLGAFSSFIFALFAEMYGFPLTIYLLSGWIQSRYPGLDPFSHEAGHLWHTLLGLKGNPHFNPVHIVSNLLVLAGFILISAAWKILYAAQKEGRLATSGLHSLRFSCSRF